jgi:hypothetical protein
VGAPADPRIRDEPPPQPTPEASEAANLDAEVSAEPLESDEVPPRPEADTANEDSLIGEAREALRTIEQKRQDLPLVEDRKRTRRFHWAFLAGFFLTIFGAAMIPLSADRLTPTMWFEVVFLGSLLGLFVGAFLAVVVGMLGDSASDFADLWCWITGRKRKRPDLDRIARRIQERSVDFDSTPADPETNVSPAGVEGPPSSDTTATEAVTSAPPQPPVPDTQDR